MFVEKGKLIGRDEPIPMLQITDNGKGMDHKEICRMLSFGHENVAADREQIGCFGVGFKVCLEVFHVVSWSMCSLQCNELVL